MYEEQYGDYGLTDVMTLQQGYEQILTVAAAIISFFSITWCLKRLTVERETQSEKIPAIHIITYNYVHNPCSKALFKQW